MEANNKAAMRDALGGAFERWYEEAKSYVDHFVKLAIAADKVRDALAAPPRNCDVGTAEEQVERYFKFCLAQHGHCDKCPAFRRVQNGCILAWAQMPYEGKEESNG